jgi:hypothetical protein
MTADERTTKQLADVSPAACRRLPRALKRMAVPFRAADTPDERSEFGPDVALLLSHLDYYDDGLSKEELKAALQVSSTAMVLLVAKDTL